MTELTQRILSMLSVSSSSAIDSSSLYDIDQSTTPRIVQIHVFDQIAHGNVLYEYCCRKMGMLLRPKKKPRQTAVYS